MLSRLVQIYPAGAQATNDLGELPLFKAVLMGSVELVAQLIYAWPEGGKEILNFITDSEDVTSWDWEVLELCMRGSVNMLEKPEGLCHRFPNLMRFKIHPKKSKRYLTSFNDSPLPLKRRCLDSTCFQNENITISNFKPFLALHVAAENRYCSSIMNRVFQRYANQCYIKNSNGMLPLHLVANGRGQDMDFMKKILLENKKAVFVRDKCGRLPLHIAIQSRADFHLIKLLLEANEPAGYENCLSHDEFCNKTPFCMAAFCKCDLDILYMLLRGNPNIM